VDQEGSATMQKENIIKALLFSTSENDNTMHGFCVEPKHPLVFAMKI
jgi:hypothetical protein